jgi:hypothetical protein
VRLQDLEVPADRCELGCGYDLPVVLQGF